MSEIDGNAELLAVRVASGATIRAAAAEIGVSESTAYRASATAGFRQRVAAIRTEATASAVGMLSDASTKAVETLVALLGESQEPSIRLQASKAILASVVPMAEALELRNRIDELEKSSPLRVAS